MYCSDQLYGSGSSGGSSSGSGSSTTCTTGTISTNAVYVTANNAYLNATNLYTSGSGWTGSIITTGGTSGSAGNSTSILPAIIAVAIVGGLLIVSV